MLNNNAECILDGVGNVSTKYLQGNVLYFICKFNNEIKRVSCYVGEGHIVFNDNVNSEIVKKIYELTNDWKIGHMKLEDFVKVKPHSF